MAENTRNYQQREADRVEMNRLALAGVSQADIASQFGVSQPQVAYDLKAVRTRWEQSSSMDISASREYELTLLANVERRAGEGLDRAELKGDECAAVRFQAVLLKVSEQRSRLVGLFANLPAQPKEPQTDAQQQARLEHLRRIFRAKVIDEYEEDMRTAQANAGADTTSVAANAEPPATPIASA